jgi:hypothetical protein
MSQVELEMPVRCFFDMLDNCVAYERGEDYSGHSTGLHAPVSSGLYNLPNNESPIGMSAADLWKYAAK